MDQESAKNWSEVLKNYAQIFAIMVAGWWTYHLFMQKDAPGLEARGNVTSDLNWYQTAGTDDWEVDFGILLENKGTTSFNISKIRIRGWEFDFGSTADHIQFFDPVKIQSQRPFFEETYPLRAGAVLPFPSHYPPGATNANSFVWLLKPDCKKRIYFLAEFYEEGKGEAPNWSTYSWGQECSHEESGGKLK